MFDKDHDIRMLNSLIETTLDSVDGYRRAADEAIGSRFDNEFRERANERERVVRDLQSEVRRLGGTPRDDGSILAAAHRSFLSLRNRVTGSDDQAVIAEVDHGESYLRGKWETALKDDRLSPDTRRAVNAGWESVRAGQEKWRAAHGAAAGS